MTAEKTTRTITELLTLEHRNMAKRLKFIAGPTEYVSLDLLYRTISLLDELSFTLNEKSRRTIVTLAAVLWTYRQQNIEGLKDFLIKILSRIGFPPSSIMVDQGFNEETGQFSSLASYIDQVAITAFHLRGQITVNQINYLLTDFQHSIWLSVSKNRLTGISAPTSAGKSFVIALKTIDLLNQKKGDVIYVVPTISLVNQVTIDYRRLLKAHSLNEIQILNTYAVDKNQKTAIYIFTQEKAIAAFSQRQAPFQNLRLLVIDEIQNVERVGNEDDQRAKTLFDMITEFRERCNPDHIILSGPRITEIGKLGKDLMAMDSVEAYATSSPVSNLTYTLHKTKKTTFFKQYNGILQFPLSFPVIPQVPVPNMGSMYTEQVHNLIFDITSNLGKNNINIIFSPTSAQAEKTALYLSARAGKETKPALLRSLIKYISDTVHSRYLLNTTLEGSVTFHHGKMPQHVRRVVEKAISMKLINNVVCTTTLMQGVNLPAQTIIVRNPNLFIQNRDGESSRLTDYEMANLRGRAGRLLKDFLGRTIILEEGQFDTPENGSLFADTTKELQSGYGASFKETKDEILNDIRLAKKAALENTGHSFLTTYIRQVAIKHPDSLSNYLEKVGINLSRKDAELVIKQVNNLAVSKEVCMQNRYWDPLVLDELFRNRARFQLPTQVFESNLTDKLKHTVELLKEIAPFYADKYFNISDDENFKRLTAACIAATEWLREETLRNILDKPYFNDPEKIGDAINRMQGKISYELPMLLHPIYDILYPGNSFLRFIELGAFRPITRQLIEHSVPRETAIMLRAVYFAKLDQSDFDFSRDILPVLERNFSRMDYWIQSQLEVLF